MTTETAATSKSKRRVWILALVIGGGLLGLVVFIGVPLLLLVPLDRAVTAVRKANTATRIAAIQTGLDAFRQDFEAYPPSKPTDRLRHTHGYEILGECLRGPEGRGWGAAAGGRLPFGQVSNLRTYGPYYVDENQQAASAEVAAPGELAGPAIYDAFPSPRRPILYFRYDPDQDPPYDVHDNPVDPTCRRGFAGQEHFGLTATYRTPDGRVKWHREDYLLISPGEDRRYGRVVENVETGEVRPATPRDGSLSRRTRCDDITNFN